MTMDNGQILIRKTHLINGTHHSILRELVTAFLYNDGRSTIHIRSKTLRLIYVG